MVWMGIGRYYSICFFKEFIARVGAFAGGWFQFGIVFAEEGVEEGGEVCHYYCCRWQEGEI